VTSLRISPVALTLCLVRLSRRSDLTASGPVGMVLPPMVANPRRSAAAEGNRLEFGVMKPFHEAAVHLRVAHLTKVPTPTFMKNGELHYGAQSTVDFEGFMLDGTGRHVAEEIKGMGALPYIYLARVAPHQRAHLDAVHAAGGVAVLTVIDRLNAPHVVEWSVARDLHKLTLEELVPFRVTPQIYLVKFKR